MRWSKQRHPDDVPTPIAVGVADFCRRAQCPASPSDVREALSFLSGNDDFRVRMLTDNEPDCSGLGPFALVDMVLGTPHDLAALRQKCGYYDLLKELCGVQTIENPPLAAPETTARPVVLSSIQRSVPKEQTIAEKIAPQKRIADKRQLSTDRHVSSMTESASPRGRYTQVPPMRQPLRELFLNPSKSLLEELLAQFDHRLAILQKLSVQYSGKGGLNLSLKDIEEVFSRHGLLANLVAKEKAMILAAFREHRGADGKVAWTLGISSSELRILLHPPEIAHEVNAIKEEFQRDILSEKRLAHRLEMLGRTRYLKDLGIERKYLNLLRRDVHRWIQNERFGSFSLEETLSFIAQQQGVSPEKLSRAVTRWNLTEEIED